MKVLTIQEPWASLIVNGYKEYEFRSWKTNYRGKILIHAGLTFDKKNKDRFLSYNLDYGKGEIIGEAEIVDCIKVNKEFHEFLLKKDYNVYKTSGFDEVYAFKLTNIKKYDNRIRVKGKLNLWNYEK